MAFYRSIKDTTIQVEAVKHDGTKTAFNNIRSLISVTGETNLAVIKSGRVYIKTREGSFIVPKGFYVVKDSYGDIFVSTPLDFTSVYEAGKAVASTAGTATGQAATVVNVIGGSEQISGTLYVDFINNYSTDQGINIEGITFVNNSINMPGIVVVGAATPAPSTMITLQNNISYSTALTVLSAAAEPIFTVLDNGGITFSSGATVNTIEINLTNDDTHLPTSGAVVDYVTAFGYVDTTGEPENNQLAVFTDADTIEGHTGLIYDSGTGALGVDIINESTANAGVIIETTLLKDGDVIPGDDIIYDLGTTDVRWNYLYAYNVSIPDNTRIYCGSDNDLQLYHTGGHSYIDSILAGAEIRIRGTDAGSNTRTMIIADPDDSVELYYGGAKKFETATGGATITGELAVDNIAIGDDGWVHWGAANEFGIRNTGGTNFITSTDHGAPLLIRGEDGAGALKTLILADPDNSVGLYYNGTQKIITTATGCTLSGIVAVTGDIALTERADHASTPADGQGYLWVRNDAPNVLIFTDDTGADVVLGAAGGGGDVDTTGTPANNQVAVFFDVDTIEGDPGFTYDSVTDSATLVGDMVFAERGDHASTPAAGYGYLWVRDDDPSALIFTNDAGTDIPLGTASYTFQNGITEAGAVVELGGALTDTVEITTGGTYDLILYVNSPGNYWNSGFRVSGDGYSHMIFENSATQFSSFNLQQYGPTIRQEDDSDNVNIFSMLSGIFEVTDAQNSKGIVYAADYSANWTDHSLVTKKWVTDNFVGV